MPRTYVTLVIACLLHGCLQNTLITSSFYAQEMSCMGATLIAFFWSTYANAFNLSGHPSPSFFLANS
ncbi:hypothetical protein RO3G_14669 [Rhizopus delemar RA 99-880]|uniref:Uncharacterized protein n=1 Tax=Rhizopus delemar (strain RA 99-880 / ATCC MYA-4621 / FGSC 9543 / NRRL 43880) TaxID=246409 RepID=I1CNC8_RHIO9|nr:hypothetical protein RO3G_14669 [Rhizopus delemar RA 99-880]|eukprot:EIE89958.1 hypothetical protein RO3G_14669 [Rhizopus delemar RA 99-880]